MELSLEEKNELVYMISDLHGLTYKESRDIIEDIVQRLIIKLDL